MPALTRLLPRSAGRLTRRTSAPPPPATPAVTLAASAGDPVALAERRAQALRAMFPMLYSLYARRADLWRAVAVERYLSQATNIADLEMRIVEVQRQGHFGYSA